MKNIKILPLVLLLFATIGHAQDKMPHDNLTSSIGYSPNTPIATNSDGISVDYYTGSFQFTRPLFSTERSNSGLKHTISLDYSNGSGVRVDDPASNIGMGFSLNVGGSIKRMVRGIPDEDDAGFTTNPSVMNLSFDSATFRNIVDGHYDGEQDIYYYQAGDNVGSFVINKNNQIVPIPKSNVKIEILYQSAHPYSGATLDSCQSPWIKITGLDGTQYYFTAFDCANINLRASIRQYFSSTYYLTQIISAYNTDTIFIDYTPHIIEYNGTFSFSNYTKNSGTVSSPNYISYSQNQRNKTRILEQRPYQIRYPNGNVITIDYDNIARLDVHSDNAIKDITITNSFNNSSYGYRFYYSYLNSDIGSNVIPYKYYGFAPEWSKVEENYRLRLDSFSRFGSADILPGYSFSYNENKLPPRGSYGGVDYWGYYCNASSRFPPSSDPSYPNLAGGDRSADGIVAQAGSIKQIFFPTGGNVAINYEGNATASGNVGGLRVQSMIYSDSMGQNNKMVKEYKYVTENGVSSGVAVPLPVFNFKYTEQYDPSTTNPNHPNDLSGPSYDSYDLVGHLVDPAVSSGTSNSYLVRSEGAGNCIQLTHGNPVGYSRVEEYTGHSNAYLHKTAYEFTTTASYSFPSVLLSNTFPYIEPLNADFLTGLPTAVTNYNAAGKKLNTIRTDYNTYLSYLNDALNTSIKLGTTLYPPTYEGAYQSKNYYPLTGKVFPVKTTSVEYFANNDSIVTTKEVVYDTAFMVAKFEKTYNGKNEQIVTRLYYPFDFNTSGAITTLKNKGIVYEPVRTEIWRDSSSVINAAISDFQILSDGSVKDFMSSVLTPVSPVPLSTYGSFNNSQLWPSYSSGFTTLTSFDRYDIKGNLIQTTSNDQTTSSIWGYKNNFIVAKVQNASASDIGYTSFEGGDKLTWQGNMPINTSDAYTGTSCISYSNGPGSPYYLTQNSLSSGQTYQLTFWAKGPAPFVYKNGTVLTIPTAGETHNGWTMFSCSITGASSVTLKPLSVSFNTKLDELRIYPVGASMTTYTYDPLFGITSTTDPSNHTVYNEYDNFGRLIRKRDLDGNILEITDYQSKQAQ